MGRNSGNRYSRAGYGDNIREYETGWNNASPSPDNNSIPNGQILDSLEQNDSKTGTGLRVESLYERKMDSKLSEYNGSNEQSGYGNEWRDGLSSIEETNALNPWFEKLSDIEKEAVLFDMKINPDMIGEYHDELREKNIDFKEYDKPTEEWILNKINHKNWEGEFSYFNKNNAGQQRHYTEVIEEYKKEAEKNNAKSKFFLRDTVRKSAQKEIFDFSKEIKNSTEENYKKQLVSKFRKLVNHLAYTDSDERLDFLSDRKEPGGPTVADIFSKYIDKFINGEELINFDIHEKNEDAQNIRDLFLKLDDIKTILEIDDRYGSVAGFLEDRELPLDNFKNENDYYAQPIAADIIAGVLKDFEKECHIQENLEWLVNVHNCDIEPTKRLLTKLYNNFPSGEAFERAKVIPIVFGSTSYEKNTLPSQEKRQANGELGLDRADGKNPGVQWKVTEEELDSVFGLFDKNINYHTVLDRDWAALTGLSKKEVSNILEWDYNSTHNHKLVSEINYREEYSETLSKSESRDIRKEVKELLAAHTDEEVKANPEWLKLLSLYEGGGGLKEQDATSAES